MDRRAFLSLIAASAALLARPGASVAQAPVIPLGEGKPFHPADVAKRARRLAAEAYAPPEAVPDAWLELEYDQYRAIRFRPDAALWRGTESPFEVQLFAPGFYFREGVAISLVADGMARRVGFDLSAFALGPEVPELPDGRSLDYSGFRLHGAINRDDHRDEFVVFQGASYFRAVGKGQAYGLSARGLALNTAEAEGEEFPAFRAFWIETPKAGTTSVVVHALLDSPSVAGAYRFDISPGEMTVMDVEALLYPRSDLAHVGLAPLTSMFLYDETNRSAFDDFRRAVHDSDGLMIVNGAGEQLWRPLANPLALQVSQFLDNNPRGFGLVQRSRELAEFADLEARYEMRPSAWVEPRDGWGAGSVTLVEIPTDREINDNIVAYWRPSQPMNAGSEHRIRYRLSWCATPPVTTSLAPVINSAMGARGESGRIAVIDFAPVAGQPADPATVTADVQARPGEAAKPVIELNPATGGLRLAFGFEPEGASSVELRAQLRDAARRPLSEVWLYRWTS